MPAPFSPPTDLIRRAEARLLARVSGADAGEDEATALADGDTERSRPRGQAGPVRGPEVGERYVFGEVFASGGLGVVRRAEDRRLGRVIAVKELLRASPEAQRRFALEAAITARLQHPGVVPLYDLGWREGGEPFYCMKLVDGESLEAKIRGAGELGQRLALLEQVIAVADTIAYAHAQQILHRDLKPANVLVGRFGETVVIDWGLAKDLSGAISEDMSEGAGASGPAISDMTEAGTVMGTLRYMAPEQARGEPVDVRSDVYALGAILYHVLSGRPPFHGADSAHLALRVSEGALRDLREVDPQIPRELAAITQRAMARDPGRRYASADEFAADLRRFQAGRLVGAHAYSLAEVARLWIRRHRVVVGAGAISLAALAGAGILAVGQERAAAAERARAEQAERTAAASAEQAERAAFEREALARAQRLDTSILRALELSEASAHGRTALEVARAAVRDAQAGGGQVMAATRALAAAMAAPRVVLEVGSVDDGEGFVRDVMFAGDTLVTYSGQFTVRSWEAASGRPLAALREVAGVLVLPGDELVTAGKEGLALRDPHTLAARRTLPEARGTAIGASPDGRLVAVRDDAGRVRVWDVRREVEVASVPTGESSHASFSADGTRMLTDYFATSLWSLPEGRRVAGLPGHGNMGAVSPNGRWVALADQHSFALELWDTAGTPRRLLRDPGPEHVTSTLSFLPDGKRVLVAGWYDAMFLYDAEEGRLLRRFELGGGTFYQAALAPDGRLVAVGGEEGTVQIFEVDSGILRARLRGEHGSVLSLRFSPAGDRLVVGTAAGIADVWEVPQGAPPRWTIAAPAKAAALAAAAGRLVLANEAEVVVHDTDDGREIARLRTEGPRERVSLSQDGRLVLTASAEGRSEVWDASTGALRCAIPWPAHTEPGGTHTFTADGAAIVIVDPERAVNVWSTDCRAIGTLRDAELRSWLTPVGAPPQLFVRRNPHGYFLVDPLQPDASVALADWSFYTKVAAVTHDGGRVLQSGYANDGKTAMQPLRVVDVETGAVIADNPHNVPRAFSLKFAPDDASFLMLTFGQALLYDTGTLELLHPFDGLPAAAALAAFSLGGERVAVADEKGAVGVWETRTGTFGGVLTQLGGRPLQLAFSGDGEDVIAVGGEVGAVRVPASTQGLLAASETALR